MKNINIEQLKNDLVTGEYGDQFTDYDSGYICDLLNEIADGNVDIYNTDLWTWARDNTGYVEQSMMEFGWDSKESSLEQLFQMGQYLEISEDLYKNLDDSIKYFIYDNLDVEYIDNELYNFIDELCNNVDHNERLDVILDQVIEYIKTEVQDESN